MTGFVRARDHVCATWDVEKVVEVGSREATVSWFDFPHTEPRVERIARNHLGQVVLEQKPRVYWLDRTADSWRVGRVLDAGTAMARVRFANHDDRTLPTEALEVRWDRPVADPCAFLAERITESPAFAEARTRFARTMIC